MIRYRKMAIIAAALIFISGVSNAQTEPKKEKKELISFPAQIGFFFPCGTHGRQSTDYKYNFSLNLVYGKIGGLNGVGINGLFGSVEGDVSGVQIAGVGNASDEVKGVQIAGFGNASDGVKGVQIAGFGNASDEMRGIQIAGFGNASDEARGIQIAGFGNAADDVEGIQIAGFSNAADEIKGIQIAGIANGADKITGLQIGGIYNRTRTLRGLQIGLVCVTDTIEKGISLSLVNIVKRGFYKEWELSFSDYANISVSYKMGAQKFYTLYAIGANFIEDNLWNVGFGFGSCLPIGNKFDFRPELVQYNYFPQNFKNARFTPATHLKFGFVYNISEKTGLSLTPSVYVMNSDRAQDSEYYKVSPINALYTHEKNNKRTTIGVGVSLGLSLR